ncbi:MAG: Glyoxalase/bleomycin resistance protein/dioxygenase [Bradyrhizobium sp.]|nr:Glyoxalase/bleomycin resistance protein/dioxygenase [Bradyrhizobium sp.]
MLSNFHHVAFRCHDAVETTRFYTEVLGLKFSHAVSNDIVGSTKEYSPHVHLFFELADGSNIAFFEVPLSLPAQKDPNTPAWVEHVAFQVHDMDELKACQKRLDDHGIEYLGPIGHYSEQYSIYFFDPNGIRLEFNLPAKTDPAERAAHAAAVLTEWTERKARGIERQPELAH